MKGTGLDELLAKIEESLQNTKKMIEFKQIVAGQQAKQASIRPPE